MEEWRQIDGFQDYQVSNLGNVKSFKQDKNGKLLSLKPNATGYVVVKLYNKRVSTGNYQFLYYDENKNYNILELPKIGGKTAKQKIINVETGVIYESITEAARQTNINKSGIARCCKGERKTAGGYHWEKVEG